MTSSSLQGKTGAPPARDGSTGSLVMSDKVAAILTQERIGKALDSLWHGTDCCPFCGHKKAGFPYYPLPPGKEDEV